MGLSIAELELQSSECLPAREVMTALGGGRGHACIVDPETTEQASTGLVAANVDAQNAGIANGNNVCVDDVLDFEDNSFLNDVLNGNRVLTNEG